MSGHIDEYHGHKVADPYHWLEDDKNPNRKKWIEAQNSTTRAYLDAIPFLGDVKTRIKELWNYPTYSSPFRRGNQYYYYHNTGLQNHSVLYRQEGPNGTPEVVLDPNTFSKDGTTKLETFSLSRDGKLAVVGLSKGGADWEELYIMDMNTKEMTRVDSKDHLKWISGTRITWDGNNGFYYSRYDEPPAGNELSAKKQNRKVCYHKIGTFQAEDTLVHFDEKSPDAYSSVYQTDDERFLFLTIYENNKGKKGNALFYRDKTKSNTEFKPIIRDVGEYRYSVIDHIGGKLLVSTNDGAPNNKLVLIDPEHPEKEHWKIVLPERKEPLQSVSIAGHKIFATYLKDAATHVYAYHFNGELIKEIPLPGLGMASGFGSFPEYNTSFYSYSSFNSPPTIYEMDNNTLESKVFRAPVVPDFNPNDYEVKQVFFTIQDLQGNPMRVPMFIMHKKGLKLDGHNPVFMTGYGGFNISKQPSFGAARLALIEQGFIYVLVNLPGGGEYGEKWHEKGMKENKQNVFNAFIGAAEELKTLGYTRNGKIAINGGSNGGLLVGAVVNQRPDLFGAAVPEVGVMDMLRFHKFTVGKGWISDYGSSDTPDGFKVLKKYSPLHNIKTGVKYPPMMVMTGDHDDRVVPAHSFKYAATLQAEADTQTPQLIRIETNSGHGGINMEKSIQETADIWAFIMYSLGIIPRYPVKKN